MRTHGSSVHPISGRGRLALVLMAALVVALLLGFGQQGAERALATGDGKISGTATVVIGSALSCTIFGDLTGGSVINNVAGFDVASVTDSLDGGGQCTGNAPFTMTGSIKGEIVEQNNSNSGVLEFPADGTFEGLLTIDSADLGQIIHNKAAEPLLFDCPDIGNGDLFSCDLSFATTVDLYNVAENTVLAEITAVKLNFSGLGVGVGGILEAPELADASLQSDDSSGTSTGVLAGVAAAVAAGTVALAGAAWYARRRWLR